MEIYVASSWQNSRCQWVNGVLSSAGHNVFDFRKPHGEDAVIMEAELSGCNGHDTFLSSEEAVEAFLVNYRAMVNADACVLVLPSGRSAHLEAGWFIGQGKLCYILEEDGFVERPELMYALADLVTSDIERVLRALEEACGVRERTVDEFVGVPFPMSR
jgi:nucleoside 2-deoxyribosyltransferase